MIVKTFKARPTSFLSDADASRIGSFLDKTFGDDPITPAAVVQVARPKRSPIHDDFEWDDKIAADAHRLQQARQIVKSIEVVYDKGGAEHETRAYHSVTVQFEDRAEVAYVPARVVWETPDYAQQVISKAKALLVSWVAQHRQYEELAKEVAMVQRVAERIAA